MRQREQMRALIARLSAEQKSLVRTLLDQRLQHCATPEDTQRVLSQAYSELLALAPPASYALH